VTSFDPHAEAAAEDEFESIEAIPVKRPSRWAMTNWPVRWKVFAIVLVPLLLAGAFGGLRIYSGWTEAKDLRLAADRADMVPVIESYVAALEGALLANSTGGDAQAALTAFDTSKQKLQQQLADTDVASDVGSGVKTLLDGGQALLDKVASNSIGLRDRIQTYAPILLTAEDTVNGSVRVDDAKIQTSALGLSRAMGARGQMLMQASLVNLGGELPEPELRTSMITVAGTEPSTLFGMNQILGVDSPDAKKLYGEFLKRMAIMSDPAVPLANNPDLLRSIEATNEVAGQIISSTTPSLTSAVDALAADKRKAAIRDSAIVGAAILLALLIVTLVARSLVRPLRRLRDGALRVAHEDLVRELEVVRSGGDPGPVQLVPVHTTEEVGQVAHAVDELHEQAVLLAADQARLQLQVSDMFETLSRRSRSLVDQQLSLIDRLEKNEQDPERLDSLFQLDHLAARMRRNGANLLVLSGTKSQREHPMPVAISALVNAAASEVEDYARVVTHSVPDDEVIGAVAGDLVHLLAELLDNGLRYSPPTSKVRVSAIHTDHGGMVIEVTDVGLGMAESDLRVANSRLQSGGEVNPYTARHMGLFVVGRLAAQHGLVVRLRSTIAGQPSSGTTAGIYVKPELLARGTAPVEPEVPSYDIPDDPYGETATALAYAEDPTDYELEDQPYGGQPYSGEPYEDEPYEDHRNGQDEVPVSLLPQRNPGSNGISGIPVAFGEASEPPPDDYDEPHDDPIPERTADVLRPAVWQTQGDHPDEPVPDEPTALPVRPTSGERPPTLPVRSRESATENPATLPAWGPPVVERPPAASAWTEEREVERSPEPTAFGTRPAAEPPPPLPVRAPQPAAEEPPPLPAPPEPVEPEPVPAAVEPEPVAVEEEPEPAPAAVHSAEPSQFDLAPDEESNSIFDKMLSEWLIDDPVELAQSTDLDWKTVWDHGWSVASAAEEAPVSRHTSSGLPVRDPGARLIPGAADHAESAHEGATNGKHRNGGAHNGEGQRGESGAENAEPRHGTHRDPDAVRSSIGSHFGGVHAGRADAREAKGTEEE
jgi:signal transduction histidine kinase